MMMMMNSRLIYSSLLITVSTLCHMASMIRCLLNNELAKTWRITKTSATIVGLRAEIPTRDLLNHKIKKTKRTTTEMWRGPFTAFYRLRDVCPVPYIPSYVFIAKDVVVCSLGVTTHCGCIFHSHVAGVSILIFEVSWSHTTCHSR
jgi:hypothetical protein